MMHSIHTYTTKTTVPCHEINQFSIIVMIICYRFISRSFDCRLQSSIEMGFISIYQSHA